MCFIESSLLWGFLFFLLLCELRCTWRFCSSLPASVYILPTQLRHRLPNFIYSSTLSPHLNLQPQATFWTLSYVYNFALETTGMPLQISTTLRQKPRSRSRLQTSFYFISYIWLKKQKTFFVVIADSKPRNHFSSLPHASFPFPLPGFFLPRPRRPPESTSPNSVYLSCKINLPITTLWLQHFLVKKQIILRCLPDKIPNWGHTQPVASSFPGGSLPALLLIP